MTLVSKSLHVGNIAFTVVAFAFTGLSLFAWLRVALGADATAMGSALVWTFVTLLVWAFVMGIERAQNRGE